MRHAFLIATFAFIVQARDTVMWTENPARENKTAELFAVRGEYEPFQVVVQAAESGLHNVTFRIGDLSGPPGHFIPRAELTVYREHYVEWNMAARYPLSELISNSGLSFSTYTTTRTSAPLVQLLVPTTAGQITSAGQPSRHPIWA
jgi:hypothetical protein